MFLELHTSKSTHIGQLSNDFVTLNPLGQAHKAYGVMHLSMGSPWRGGGAAILGNHIIKGDSDSSDLRKFFMK